MAGKARLGAFDIIGDVAVIEEGGREEVREILKRHKHVRTVLKKGGERKGRLRLRKFRILYGKKTITIHIEHGFKLRLDVAKCYFSPRESTERQRIAGQVKKGENVLVMFGGIGPYAIAIARKQPGVNKVYCVELNRTACKYMRENIELNRLKYIVEPVCGDVGKACPGLKGMDRVVMPLPKGAYKYLALAIKCTKKGGVIHLYYWGKLDSVFQEAGELVKKECRKLKRRFRILNKRKVLPYGPGIWKVCVEFRVY
jgi:tRNA (guanine37-N1)-methyltransferase